MYACYNIEHISSQYACMYLCRSDLSDDLIFHVIAIWHVHVRIAM